MSKLHPDVQQSQASSQDNDTSLLSATDVTRAYEVLKHPYTRAVHLLELVQKQSPHTTATTSLDQEFYKNIMDLREEIEMASQDEDIRRLLKENKERKMDTLQKLTQAFSNQNYDQAQRLVAELRYWETCEEILQDKL